MRLFLFLCAVAAFTGCGGARIESLEMRQTELQRELYRLSEAYQAQQRSMSELRDQLDLLKDRSETRALHASANFAAPVSSADLGYGDLPVVRLSPDATDEPEMPMIFESDSGVPTITQEDMDEHYGTYGSSSRSSSGASNLKTPRHPVAPPPEAAFAGNIGVAPLAPNSPLEQSVAVEDPAIGSFKAAKSLMEQGSYTKAIESFQSFVNTYPNHEYADNALQLMGDCLYARAEYGRALAAFRKLVETYPTGNKVPDALLKIGFCQEKMGNLAQSRETLTRLRALFPNTKAAEQAATKLGERQSL